MSVVLCTPSFPSAFWDDWRDFDSLAKSGQGYGCISLLICGVMFVILLIQTRETCCLQWGGKSPKYAPKPFSVVVLPVQLCL